MKALFSTADIARVFESQLIRLREEIGSLSADYLASTAESELVVNLKNKYDLTPCCKNLMSKVSETERKFLFRNRDDPNRELQLAVLLFDVPREAV